MSRTTKEPGAPARPVGRPSLGNRRHLSVRVPPDLAKEFADDADSASIPQNQLMAVLLADRYLFSHTDVGDRPRFLVQDKSGRVAVNYMVPTGLRSLFEREASEAGLSQSDLMTDILYERRLRNAHRGTRDGFLALVPRSDSAAGGALAAGYGGHHQDEGGVVRQRTA